MSSRAPYGGTQRGLVIAFDVGTTFSGAAYSVLDPAEVPKIQSVSRYPGQPSGDYKIPSILYYTQDGQVRAVGAEAREAGFELVAEDEDLIFVEWFKLHMCPESMDAEGMRDAKLKPLPLKKTAVDVFADFLAYLFACTRRYILETHASGASLWNSVQQRIDFVISHPNGWEGPQQARLRQAAVRANLIPDTQSGHSRLHFVTEGEASLHFCINSGLAADVIEDGAKVMIVDAGGGTVDITTYRFVGINPIAVEEIATPGCILQGSTRVNARALQFLKAKLANSSYGHDEDLREMMDNFEKSTKPTFKNDADRSYIKFGTMRDQDLAVGIRSGQLALEGSDIAQFFRPSLMGIVSAIRAQLLSASEPVNSAFLVGGFAASPWLFANLQDVLKTMDMDLSRPDSHTNKAVAEGAASFFLTSFVSIRVARVTYGVTCRRPFDETDPEHLARRHTALTRPSGRLVLPDCYLAYIEKGEKIQNEREIRHSFFREATHPSHLKHVSTGIIGYRGNKKSPKWTNTEPECFSTLCTVRANTTGVTRTKQHGLNGPYYTVDYDIVILCGLTELKAQISWMENGVEKRGDAQIVYDDDEDGGEILY